MPNSPVSVGHHAYGLLHHLTWSLLHCRFFKKKLGYIPEHDDSVEQMRPDFQVSSNNLWGNLLSSSLSCLYFVGVIFDYYHQYQYCIPLPHVMNSASVGFISDSTIQLKVGSQYDANLPCYMLIYVTSGDSWHCYHAAPLVLEFLRCS